MIIINVQRGAITSVNTILIVIKTKNYVQFVSFMTTAMKRNYCFVQLDDCEKALHTQTLSATKSAENLSAPTHQVKSCR